MTTLFQRTLVPGYSCKYALYNENLLYIAFSSHLEVRDDNFKLQKTIHKPFSHLFLYQQRVYGLTRRTIEAVDMDDVMELDQPYHSAIVHNDMIVCLNHRRVTLFKNKERVYSKTIVSDLLSGVSLHDSLCLLSRNGLEWYQVDQQLRPYKTVHMDIDNAYIYAIPSINACIVSTPDLQYFTEQAHTTIALSDHIVALSWLQIKKRDNDMVSKGICATSQGQYYVIKVFPDRCELDYLQAWITPTTMCAFNDSLFIGSHFHNSYWCTLQLQVLDTLMSLSPIQDMHYQEEWLIQSHPNNALVKPCVPVTIHASMDTIPIRILSNKQLLYLVYASETIVLQDYQQVDVIPYQVLGIYDDYMVTTSHVFYDQEIILSTSISHCAFNNTLYIATFDGQYHIQTLQGTIWSGDHPIVCLASAPGRVAFCSDHVYMYTDTLSIYSDMPCHSLLFFQGQLHVGYRDGKWNDQYIGCLPVDLYQCDNKLFITSDQTYIYPHFKTQYVMHHPIWLDDLVFFNTQLHIGTLGPLNKHFVQPLTMSGCIGGEGEWLIGNEQLQHYTLDMDLKSSEAIQVHCILNKVVSYTYMDKHYVRHDETIEVKEPLKHLCICQDHLLGASAKVLYDLTTGQEVKHFTQIINVHAYRDWVVVGDMIRSCFLFRLKETLEAVCRDPKPKWTTTCCVVEDGILLSDEKGQIYGLQSNGTYMQSVVGHSMGDPMNCMTVMPIEHPYVRSKVVYGTVGGSIGLLLVLTEEVYFLLSLLPQERMYEIRDKDNPRRQSIIAEHIVVDEIKVRMALQEEGHGMEDKTIRKKALKLLQKEGLDRIVEALMAIE